MTKTACTLLVVLSAFPSTIHAQNKTTIDCTAGKKSPNCTTEYENGQQFLIAISGPIKVVVAYANGVGANDYGRIVAVQNSGDTTFDIGPELMEMKFTHDSAIGGDPDKLINHSQKKAAWANVLATSLDAAAYGDQPVVVAETDGNRTTVYDSDVATERSNARTADIEAAANNLRNQALRRTTVHKDQIVGGVVYFERPKGKDRKHDYPQVLTVHLGDTDFLF